MGRLNATALMEVEGSTRRLGEFLFTFDRGVRGKPATWAGGEGLVAPVRIKDERRRLMLKIFHDPAPERRARTAFMGAMRLSQLIPGVDPLFSASVLKLVEGSLEIAGVEHPVMASLSRFLNGKSWEILCFEWDPPLTVRVQLARRLALAIEMLESVGLVHGDLSGGNVFVLTPETEPRLGLIDFDAFRHQNVPSVPLDRGRTAGTPGYQPPAASHEERDRVLDADRYAMAILIFELVALRPSDLDLLPRDTLLSQRDIDARAPVAPETIVERWPEGWVLLEKALVAERASLAPSPAEWRRVLANALALPGAAVMEPSPPSVSSGFLVVVRARDANDREHDRKVRLARGRGTFETISPRLSWLEYALNSSEVYLSGKVPSGTRFFVRRGGPAADLDRCPAELKMSVNFGDVIVWDDFTIFLS